MSKQSSPESVARVRGPHAQCKDEHDREAARADAAEAEVRRLMALPARARAARLTEALRDIAENPCCDSGMMLCCDRYVQVARAALEEKP